jgi:uncharacterized protein YoxC
MNTTKAVYNKLFSKKTELETHKIELGLVDDLKKLSTESNEISQNINKDSIELSKLFSEVRDLAEDFNKINESRKDKIAKGKSNFTQIQSLLEKTQEQAKDLGISPKNIPNFSKAQKISSELRSSVNDVQKYSNIKF